MNNYLNLIFCVCCFSIPLIAESSNVNGRISPIVKGQTEIQKQFEGTLLYVSDEFHNTAIRKMSNGTAYIGERAVVLTIKDDRMHINDLSTHIHEIVVPTEEKVYVYSDLSNEGLLLPLSFYRLSHSALDLDYNGTPEVPIAKSGEFNIIETLDDYDGSHDIITGCVLSNDNAIARTSFCITNEYIMPDVYRWYFNGYKPDGILQKYLLSVNSQLPLFLGQAKSLISCHLEDIDYKSVSEDELTPPKEIVFKVDNDGHHIWGFQKKNNKYLKKFRLPSQNIKEDEMRQRINRDWPISETWLKTDVKSASIEALNESTLHSLSESFKDVATSIDALLANNSSNQNKLSVGESNVNSTQTLSADEYFYIPDIINEIEVKLRPYRNEIINNEQAREKTRRNAKTKMTRIGGKLVKVLDPSQTKIYSTTGKVSENSDRQTIAYFERIKKSVLKYGMINKTDYISADIYQNIIHAHFVADTNARETRRKQMKQKSEDFSKKIYDNYVSMLLRHSYKNGRDLVWIKRTQEKMKEIRETCGCEKSPWEVWDGVNDPA